MARFRYLQLDVFADRPGAGNPLGVVFDADALDGAAMQAIAAWTNLSETIFFLAPPEGADYRVRIFTPRQELPFAGHPSVGAGWAAVEAGLATPRDGALVQACAAGLLPVRVSDAGDGAREVSVRAPRGRPVEPPPFDASLVTAATAGMRTSTTTPALWNNGPHWWLVELADADAVRGLAPDLPAIAALTTATGAVGLAVHAAGTDGSADVVVRAFCPADNIPEDPVTGSANALVAAALNARGALPGRDGRYVASQGREMGRDGRVHVHVDAAGEAWIGGRVQPVIAGTFDW